MQMISYSKTIFNKCIQVKRIKFFKFFVETAFNRNIFPKIILSQSFRQIYLLFIVN